MSSYLNELVDWSAGMNQTEKTGGHRSVKQSSAKLPPIRNKIDIEQSIRASKEHKKAAQSPGAPHSGMPVVEELERFKRDNSAMPDYYKAWDKFGKKLDDEESDEAPKQAINPAPIPEKQLSAEEMLQRTSGAAPNMAIVVKGGLRKQVSVAEEFKQQGNSYFVSLEFSAAIDCYNKCLRAIESQASSDAKAENEMRKVVFSNRAQAYLKLKVYSKAFDDASAALLIDSAHVKSIGRRGTAAFYLARYKQAQADFVRGIQLEPQNKTFAEYLARTASKLQKVRAEAYEKLNRRVVFTDLSLMGFEDEAHTVPIIELHLDQDQFKA